MTADRECCPTSAKDQHAAFCTDEDFMLDLAARLISGAFMAGKPRGWEADARLWLDSYRARFAG